LSLSADYPTQACRNVLQQLHVRAGVTRLCRPHQRREPVVTRTVIYHVEAVPNHSGTCLPRPIPGTWRPPSA